MTAARHIGNLLDLYEQAAPEEVKDAVDSYPRYHRLLAKLAARWGTSIEIACGVFSALSPNNDYLGNLRDAATVLQAAAQGIGPDAYSVATYGQNKRKAHDIAMRVKTPADAITAKKTRAFYLNCLHPETGDAVTVDGHMFFCWQGHRGRVTARRKQKPGQGLPVANVSSRLYEEIADGIRLLARIKGVTPCQAQAVLWQQYRKTHNIQRSRQPEFPGHESDEIIAGLDHKPRPPKTDWKREKKKRTKPKSRQPEFIL